MMLVANKTDSAAPEAAAQNLRSLGIGEVHAVSAQHGRGIGDLLDALVAALPEAPVADAEREQVPAVCILGRPNVGKSSILNALLGEDRVVVHDAPGTTRDPIDTFIEVDGTPVVLIDTAGLRRRGQMRDDVEHYSQIRALQAAERSDWRSWWRTPPKGSRRPTSRGRPRRPGPLRDPPRDEQVGPRPARPRPHPGRLRAKSRQRPTVEVASAVTGEGLHRLLPAALRLQERPGRPHPHARAQRALRELAAERPGPRKRHRRLSLRYLVQTGEAPPVFRLDVNDRSLDDARLRVLAREPPPPAVRPGRRAPRHRGPYAGRGRAQPGRASRSPSKLGRASRRLRTGAFRRPRQCPCNQHGHMDAAIRTACFSLGGPHGLCFPPDSLAEALRTGVGGR